MILLKRSVENSKMLIKDGNPIYLGMLLVLFGLGFIFRSLSSFLVIPVFIFLLETKFIKIEELMLTNKNEILWNE